jgi:hypothetical protein
MVFTLMAPSVIKMEHHHDHFTCRAKNEKHYHRNHEVCAICSFEFSLFSANHYYPSVSRNGYTDGFIDCINPSFFSCDSRYTVLLRAPPLFVISI